MTAFPRPVLSAGLTLLALVLPPGPVEAQGTGSIAGRAFDAASYEPLPGVQVHLVDHVASTVSDSEGRFAFSGVPEGRITFRVTHPGYGSVVESFEVTNQELTFIQFPMIPVNLALEELLVEVRRAEARGSSDFEERVAGGGPGAATAADLLAQRVPGLRVDRTTGALGGGAQVTIRGLSSIAGSNAPAIYLDGIRIDDRASSLRGSREPQAVHILEMIPASDVKQIRVLRGPAASAFYGDSSNGVIVIETIRDEAGRR